MPASGWRLTRPGMTACDRDGLRTERAQGPSHHKKGLRMNPAQLTEQPKENPIAEVAAARRPIEATELSPQALYDKCMALASNLWWSWHPEVTSIFRDLDPILWRQLDHNPIALLKEFEPEKLATRATE